MRTASAGHQRILGIGHMTVSLAVTAQLRANFIDVSVVMQPFPPNAIGTEQQATIQRDSRWAFVCRCRCRCRRRR